MALFSKGRSFSSVPRNSKPCGVFSHWCLKHNMAGGCLKEGDWLDVLCSSQHLVQSLQQRQQPVIVDRVTVVLYSGSLLVSLVSYSWYQRGMRPTGREFDMLGLQHVHCKLAVVSYTLL